MSATFYVAEQHGLVVSTYKLTNQNASILITVCRFFRQTEDKYLK